MAYSSGTQSLVKLAAAWVCILAIAAVVFSRFDELREVLGLKLAPTDLGALVEASEPAAGRRPDAADARRSSGTVAIRAGDHGHFYAQAYLNGRPAHVMVDTGASLVALTWDDARRAGIFLSDRDFKTKVGTANGTARVAIVTLDSVVIEDITVRNVTAAVAEPGRLQMTLLGMTFLSRLARTEMSRGVLILQQ